MHGKTARLVSTDEIIMLWILNYCDIIFYKQPEVGRLFERELLVRGQTIYSRQQKRSTLNHLYPIWEKVTLPPFGRSNLKKKETNLPKPGQLVLIIINHKIASLDKPQSAIKIKR